MNARLRRLLRMKHPSEWAPQGFSWWSGEYRRGLTLYFRIGSRLLVVGTHYGVRYFPLYGTRCTCAYYDDCPVHGMAPELKAVGVK